MSYVVPSFLPHKLAEHF